jgi:hypothetical protein
MHEGSRRCVGSFSLFFRLTLIGRRMFRSTEASISCSNLSATVTYEHMDSASSPTRLQLIGDGRITREPDRCSPDTPRPAVPKDPRARAASPEAALLGTSMPS